MDSDHPIVNLVKKGSQALSGFLEGLTQEDNSSFHGHIDISPVEDFQHGIHFDILVDAGKEFDNYVNGLPDYFKSSPVVYGLEIRVKDPSQVGIVIETLEGVKGMASAIPNFDTLVEQGLNISFRAGETSVFVDISFTGKFLETVNQSIGNVNLQQINFTGQSKGVIVSELKPLDLLNSSLEEIIKKLCNFKIQFKSEYDNVKILVNAFAHAFQSIYNNLPKKAKAMLGLLRVLGCFRKISYEFHYDAASLANLVREIVGESICHGTDGGEVAVQQSSQKVAEFQTNANQAIEGTKPMLDDVIAPFKEALVALDVDTIGVHFTFDKLKFHAKYSLNLPGVTAWVNEKILS